MKSKILETSWMKVEKDYKNLDLSKVVSEIIWNSLDADANNIYVTFHNNKITWIDFIEIKDDWIWINYEDIDWQKWNYWYSDKLLTIKSKKWRFFHWKNWVWRYAWLALWTLVEWETVYTKWDNNYLYKIQIDENNLKKFDFSDDVELLETDKLTWTIVKIKNLKNKKIKKLGSLEDDIINEFAHYLKIYETQWIKIFLNWKEINFSKAILNYKKYSNIKIEYEESEFKFNVEFYHWNKKWIKNRHLCRYEWISIYEDNNTWLNEKDFWHSVFITADFLNEETISLAINSTLVNEMQSKVRDLLLNWFLREYYQNESSKVITTLKTENLYPYKEIEDNPVKEVEKNLFDLTIWRLIEASWTSKILWNWNTQRKALIISLLKNTIEKWGDEILNIFQSVLKLNEWEIKDFNYMIKKHWLSNTIKMSKIVSDKISFLNEINELLYWELKNNILERKHLHLILEKELWVFGDWYELWTSDKPFKNLLEKHISLLWKTDLNYKDLDLTKERPDLFLYKQFASVTKNKFDNLVVELKRPSKKIWNEEILQIKWYAQKIIEDNSFDKNNNTWTFILVSSDFDNQVEFEMKDKKDWVLQFWEWYKIYVKKWSEILWDLRWRYEFIKKKLEDDAFNYSKELNYIDNEHKDIIQEIKAI